MCPWVSGIVLKKNSDSFIESSLCVKEVNSKMRKLRKRTIKQFYKKHRIYKAGG